MNTSKHPVITVKTDGRRLVCGTCSEPVRSISKSNTTLLHRSEWNRR